jgi:two-component system OmpR family sensor kinase
MDAQRRFVADAAHELRSPLTAMSLQAERLADAPMSEQAHERLATLQQGIERGRNLLDQLLTLARAQDTTQLLQKSISVQDIFRRVLEDLLPLAEAKHIDMGVEGKQDVQVWISELDMVTVVKNLIDNAIRYTPNGGRIDLSVVTMPGRGIFTVQDNGPGIAVAERERVFDPFYRTLGSGQMGSGLGLSIVKAISDRMGAVVQLGFTDEANSTGLRVSVSFPLTESCPATAVETQ